MQPSAVIDTTGWIFHPLGESRESQKSLLRGRKLDVANRSRGQLEERTFEDRSSSSRVFVSRSRGPPRTIASRGEQLSSQLGLFLPPRARVRHEDRRTNAELGGKERPLENAKDSRPVRSASRMHGNTDSRQGRSRSLRFGIFFTFSFLERLFPIRSKRNRDDRAVFLSARLKTARGNIPAGKTLGKRQWPTLVSVRFQRNRRGWKFEGRPETVTVNTHAYRFCLTPAIVRARTRG